MLRELTTACAVVAIFAGVATAAVAQTTTTRPPFGCFRVKASSLNVRDRPFSTAAVIGAAKQGDILVKRRRWCTWHGFWCAVSYGRIDGYADKSPHGGRALSAGDVEADALSGRAESGERWSYLGRAG